MMNGSITQWISTQSFRWLTVAIVTGAGAFWLFALGSVPVIRVSSAMDTAVPFWYMLTAFPILGMLVADVFVFRVSHKDNLFWVELSCQIALLVLLSYLRLALKLPISGHSLLFSYFILRRTIIKIPGHRTRRIELSIAVIFFLIMAYVKLLWWSDYVTPILGIGIAAVMMFISYIAVAKRVQ
jgi:hypothetical protein